MSFIRALWAGGRRFTEFAWKVVTKYKPVSIFGLFLILTLIFRVGDSPILFVFTVAAYISGAILIFWLFSFIRLGKD